MSCSMCSEETLELIKQESINQTLDPWAPIKLSKFASESNMKNLGLSDSPLMKESNTNCFELPRGGCVILTRIGPIQFGIPPETVKDSLNLGFEIPTYYVIPSQRWDKMFHLSIAEFEFPAYFNFFVKKSKINLICSKEAEISIKKVFQETLLGPKNFDGFEKEFYEGYEGIPDIRKELNNFAKNPFNPSEPLTVDLLLNFIVFDENGVVYLPKGVCVRKEKKSFVVLEDDIEKATIRDRIRVRVSEDVEDYAHKWRYGLFMNPSIEIDQKKLEIYKEKYKPVNFNPPGFGVTILGSGHGFDPKGNNSGYIIWINGRGVMVDPPPFSTHLLKKMGIPSLLIEWIIITHCHADHDAGSFQKILESGQVEVITTKTILCSFVRKYANIVDMQEKDILGLFKFRPVIIGAPLKFNGATFNFFYTLHSIPCIGFAIEFQKKSIYFSADTYYDPENMLKLIEKGVISQKRYESLISNKFNHDLIFHEAGVPPIHTPMKVLSSLPNEIKERLFLVHVAAKDIPLDSGLKMALPGLENTISLPIENENSLKMLRTLDILSSIKIFEKCSLKNVRDLLDSAEEVSFKAGEPICKEGALANEFYIIMNGIVKIYSNTIEKAFERYCSIGDYFGEAALKSSQVFRRANVEAVTDVKVLSIKRHEFWFVFGDNDEVIDRMLNLITAPRSKALNALSKNSFFINLNTSQKIQMELMMKEKNVIKNDVLWVKNSNSLFAIMVSKGELEFFECPEAEELPSVTLGCFVCEFESLLNDNLLTTNLRAKSDAEIFVISHKDMMKFLRNNPGLLIALNKMKYIQ